MKTSRLVTLACLVIASIAAGGTAAHAAAGSLDPSFGTGGVVQTSYLGPAPADALLQPDGKIVVITGFDAQPTATETFGLLRYLPSGALDGSFGTAGRASTEFTNFINSANDA